MHDKESLQRIREQEEEIRSLKRKVDSLSIDNDMMSEKLDLFQTVANFSYGWELWIDQSKEIKYCSPSCQDITGYSSAEIQQTANIWSHIIYPDDYAKFSSHIHETLTFSIIDQSLEFRILTRTKQLRWSEINTRSIYDLKGKYLGIRASIHDITKLKSMQGQVQILTESHAQEKQITDRYKTELEQTERELISTLLLVSNKNTLLAYIKKKVRSIRAMVNKDVFKVLEDINEKILSATIVSSELETFKMHFEKMHPGFFHRLSQQFPKLTQKDITLAAYLRLNLSSKEIAGLLNITPASVEISRVRLRKKMNLTKSDRLTVFIGNI